ncbi:MAG: hypothetical protein KDA32_14645, partial [Phycisphaerales bacterium]|nr:hypothetical protein [Phycisphaerales bacterium]
MAESETQTPQTRRAWLAPAILIALLVAGGAAYAIFAPAIIESAYRGESLDFLNNTIARLRDAQPHARDLAFFQTRGRILATRAGMLLCVAFGFALLWRHRVAAIAHFRRLFNEPADPLNLAFTRIVVFATLLIFTWELDAVTFARLPDALEVAPSGIGPLIMALPHDPNVVGWLVLALRVACGLVIVGLFTRPAAIISAILSLYVLGLPQVFGKVNHYHHLLWFATLLAASRCADTL